MLEVRDMMPVASVDNPTLGHGLERQRIEPLPINGCRISSHLDSILAMEGSRAYGLREGSQEFALDGATLDDRNTGGNLRFNANIFKVLSRPGNPTGVGGNAILRTLSSGQSGRELQLA